KNPRERELKTAIEVTGLPALLVEGEERLDFARGHGPAEGAGREVRHDSARAGGFVRRGRRPAHQHPAPGRGVLRWRRVERTFDANRADVREKREARGWPGLQGVAREVAIEIQQRREIRGEECHAERVPTGRRVEPHGHGGIRAPWTRSRGRRSAASLAAAIFRRAATS